MYGGAEFFFYLCSQINMGNMWERCHRRNKSKMYLQKCLSLLFILPNLKCLKERKKLGHQCGGPGWSWPMFEVSLRLPYKISLNQPTCKD